MGPFTIQHFYFTAEINVWCTFKVQLKKAIVSNIPTINWMPTFLECYLKEKTHVGFMRSWGLAAWAWGQGRSAGTVGKQLPEAQWGGHGHSQPQSWALAELWPLPCQSCHRLVVAPDPGAECALGQHGCYQVFYDPGKTRNRHWFTSRIMHLLVQPARSCYATGECFDEVPKQKVHPRAHFPKKH